MTAGDLRSYVQSWLDVLDEVSHYELLGVARSSKTSEIQEGFHRFSSTFHPDRHRRSEEDVRMAVTRIYTRGVEAYRVLRDPGLRADYDMQLARARRSDEGPRGRSLEELCTTKAGRLHARQAERAITAGELRAALALLHRSLAAEGANRDLQGRIEDLRCMAMLSEPPGAATEEQPAEGNGPTGGC